MTFFLRRHLGLENSVVSSSTFKGTVITRMWTLKIFPLLVLANF